MAKRVKKSKGVFGATRLPVAGRYFVPRRRRREWLVGLALAGLASAVLGLGYARRGARTVALAPLSSHHATFEATCGSCHASFGGVADRKCLDCHERLGEEGHLSIAAHAERFGAAAADAATLACAACHAEHGGRPASITAVADAVCAGCHGIASFAAAHPEFQFARDALPDDGNLTFAHGPHVARVAKQKGFADYQRSCLFCHQPLRDGSGFEPLDFERQCGECHLAAGTATAWLPSGDPAAAEPGVVTLETIRGENRPGTRWAWFQNPEELRTRGKRIAKQPVHHEDPWVLDNLSRIRQVLYPDAGLGSLLATAVLAPRAADVPAAGELTAEVIAALRDQARELRSRPEVEVQADLDRIDELLDQAQARHAAGESPKLADLALPAAPDPSLGETRIAALLDLARELTGPCQQCHVVSNGAILRVQKDQKVLRRARFDHRAHVILKPICTDCHSAIPTILDGEGTVDRPVQVDAADLAETQNLPRLAVCRECHAPRLTDQTCVTCHDFHPGDRRHLADLRIWVTPAEESQ